MILGALVAEEDELMVKIQFAEEESSPGFGRFVAGAGGAGGLGVDAFAVGHGEGAFEVPGIADDEGCFPTPFVHDEFGFLEILLGVFGFRFEEEGFAGDALVEAVVEGDFGFGEGCAVAEASGEDDEFDALFLVEADALVDAFGEDGGRLVVVGGGAEDDGAVGGASVIGEAEAMNGDRLQGQVGQQRQGDAEEDT